MEWEVSAFQTPRGEPQCNPLLSITQGVEFLMENEKKHEKFPIYEKFSHVSMRKRGGQISLVNLINAIYRAS